MSFDLADTLAQETNLERQYTPVALGVEINRLMPEGVSYQAFARSYKAFRDNYPTPHLLLQAQAHALSYIAAQGFEDEAKRQGAYVYVLSRVWKVKSANGAIFLPGLLDRVRDAEIVRKQTVEIYKAVARAVKSADEDSYAAGMKHSWAKTLEEANAVQVAAFIATGPAMVLTVGDGGGA
jgi:hypothetical protein